MRKFYFSTGGSLSNSGTELSPWSYNKITALGDGYFKDDHLYFKAGETITSDVVLDGCGSYNGPLIITRYGVGADPKFRTNGGATGLAVIVMYDCVGHIIVERMDIDAAYQATVSGIGTVAVLLTYGHKLTVRNCLVTKCHQSGISYGYLTSDSPSESFQAYQNEVSYCGDNGIDTYGFAATPRIYDNYIHHIGVGSANVGLAYGGDGISLHQSTFGGIIEDNVITNCKDGIHNINTVVPQGVIVGNYIKDCEETCIQLDDYETSSSPNLRWWIISNILCGSSTATGDGVIQFGRFKDTGVITNSYGSLQDNVFRNNLIYNEGVIPSLFVSYPSTTHATGSRTLDCRQNIFINTNTGTTYVYIQTRGSSPINVLNNNCYTGGTTISGWYLDTGVTPLTAGSGYSFAQWQAKDPVYNDPNSFIASPLIIGNPTKDPYNARLSERSPCIGAGTSLAETEYDNVFQRIRRDFLGKFRDDTVEWDIGPFQRFTKSSFNNPHGNIRFNLIRR